MDRRHFLQAAAGATASLLTTQLRGDTTKPVPILDRICLFTDHLDDHGFTYAEVAAMIRQLKIAGPDLTVRGGGLVLPERVTEDLPKAAAAFKDQGLSIPMLTTNLTSARDATAKPIFAAMQAAGVRYFKLGYYHYHDLAKWESEIESQRLELAGLLEIGKPYGVHAGFHNHAGAGIGGAIWDAWEMLKPLDPARVGFFFDPSHASLEGAKHTWKLNLQRIAPRLSMVAVKDYVWEKSSQGWSTRWCPLGQGMVNWPEFFALLKTLPFPGPLSLHIEYDPGGNTRVERIDNGLAAAEKDLSFLRKHLS